MPDPVARDVGANVEVGAEFGDAGIARPWRDADDGAGFGIELAEAHEVARDVLGEDREVALHVAARDAGSGTAELARADEEAGGEGGGG